MTTMPDGILACALFAIFAYWIRPLEGVAGLSPDLFKRRHREMFSGPGFGLGMASRAPTCR